MIKPTEKINRAILSLNGNHDWEVIKQWLDDSYVSMATDHIMDMVSNEARYRILQGQAFHRPKLRGLDMLLHIVWAVSYPEHLAGL